MARGMHDLIDRAGLAAAAECLRTVAHPHRLRMVQMVLHDEHTVGELAKACEIRPHVASEHLRRMKDRGLLASRRDGRRTYYRVAEEGLAGIMRCVEARYGNPQGAGSGRLADAAGASADVGR